MFTNSLKEKVLKHAFLGTSFAATSDCYVALQTSSIAEVNGNGYARQKVTFDQPVSLSGTTTILNNIEVRFPIATANWGTITHISVYDSLTGGTKLDETQLSRTRVVSENDQLTLAVGNVSIILE